MMRQDTIHINDLSIGYRTNAGQFGDCPNRCSGSGLRSIP